MSNRIQKAILPILILGAAVAGAAFMMARPITPDRLPAGEEVVPVEVVEIVHTSEQVVVRDAGKQRDVAVPGNRISTDLAAVADDPARSDDGPEDGPERRLQVARSAALSNALLSAVLLSTPAWARLSCTRWRTPWRP